MEVAIGAFRAGVDGRNKAVDIELKMKRNDGSIFQVELNSSEFNNGNQKGTLLVLHDITSRKNTLEQLRESEEKFRSIAEHTTDLISISDVNGVLVYASNAAKTIFQFEPEEMCGHKFIEYVDDDSIELAMNEFKKGLDSNTRLYNLEFKMKRKDGSTFFGELHGSTFMYGNNYGFLVVIRDITDRKQVQEELEEKMNELVRFHNLTVDREMTMIELKEEVNKLLLESGKEGKYKIVN
jgi:PAS domain S-box-containing protein